MMRNVPAVTTKILACSPRNLGRELDVRKTLLSLRKGKCFFLTSPLYRTPQLGAFSRPKFCGVAPARPELLGAVFCPVPGSQQAICNARCNASRITKGGETLGTLESTVKATENYNPPGPPGGRS